MRRFENSQRVKVLEGLLEGKIGVVVRLRMADNGAWVEMDEDIPESMRSFPANDSRGKHVLLYPEDCEAA